MILIESSEHTFYHYTRSFKEGLYYLKGIRGHKFSRNKFSRLTDQKPPNFAEFIFAIEPIVVDIVDFNLAIDRFESSQ